MHLDRSLQKVLILLVGRLEVVIRITAFPLILQVSVVLSIDDIAEVAALFAIVPIFVNGV